MRQILDFALAHLPELDDMTRPVFEDTIHLG